MDSTNSAFVGNWRCARRTRAQVICGAVFGVWTIVFFALAVSGFCIDVRHLTSPLWVFAASSDGVRVAWWDESGRESPTPDNWYVGSSDLGLVVGFAGTYRAGMSLHGARYEIDVSLWWLAALSLMIALGFLRRPVSRFWRQRRDMRDFAVAAALTGVLGCFLTTRVAASPREALTWLRDSNEIVFPLLFVCVLIGALLSVRAWDRRPPVFIPPECETCGYNLTGNQSGRCPECGQAMA